MNRIIVGLSLAVVCGAAGVAFAQARGGYLTAASAPQAELVLPPAPVEGTERYEQDRRVFKATRSLEGSPRWALAQADNDYQTPYLLKAFSCSAGANLTPANAPILNRILQRMLSDQDLSSRRAKQVFLRKRPYLIDEGNICIAKSESLAESPDYPSGHTTLGWTAGLIIAELVPDRATQVLVRARAYGESRAVCGVHNASAIEGGRTTGAAVFAAMHGSQAFRADMDIARKEIEAAKAAGPAPDAAACKAEADLIAKTPY